MQNNGIGIKCPIDILFVGLGTAFIYFRPHINPVTGAAINLDTLAKCLVLLLAQLVDKAAGAGLLFKAAHLQNPAIGQAKLIEAVGFLVAV